MPSTVFIVDDEKNIRRTVRMVLEGEGYAVEEASSGEEALARLPDVGADVMLLDVQLPGISGLDTIERVAKLKMPEPMPTVIMISGHATLADAVRAVTRARVTALPAGAAAGGAPVLIVRERTEAPFFVAARVETAIGATLALPAGVLQALELAVGDEVAYLPLPNRS